MRVDRRQPLLETIWRRSRLEEGWRGWARKRQEDPRDRDPGRQAAQLRQGATIAFHRAEERGMSRPLAGALFALALAGFGGSELLAIRNKPQQTDANKPADVATQALNRGLSRLEKADRLEIKSPELARKEYAAALTDFQTAATAKPDNYRAHNG